MVFLHGVQPGLRLTRGVLKRGLTLLRVRPNLEIVCFHKRHKSKSARSEISMSEDSIKKYIKKLGDKHEYDSRTTANSESDKVSRLLTSRAAVAESIKSLKELGQQDAEMKKLGKAELEMYQQEINSLDDDLLEALLDDMGRETCDNILLEVKPGVGGQEAMLFANDLLAMYVGYLTYLNFDYCVVEMQNEDSVDKLRSATLAITGYNALELFRHEGGVHRVQRVPATERSGRIHTSTASVAILPQPTDIEIDLKEKDLRIETKRGSGAGGQHRNTTDSVVRIQHMPTGIAVEAKDRSQIKNRKEAMSRLRLKLYTRKLNEQMASSGKMRKNQMGLGHRNEKVRTYNYNQCRVTDHRISEGTMYNLEDFLKGGEALQEFHVKLQRKLKIKLLREAIEKASK